MLVLSDNLGLVFEVFTGACLLFRVWDSGLRGVEGDFFTGAMEFHRERNGLDSGLLAFSSPRGST